MGLKLVKFKEVDRMRVNEVVNEDLYSFMGELLFPKGTQIAENQINVLKRRFNKYLYAFREVDDDVPEIFIVDKKKLNNEHLKTEIENPLFRNVKRGNEGLVKLLESKEAVEISLEAVRSVQFSNPVGFSIKNKTETLKANERTEKYKNHITDFFEEAFEEVKAIYVDLAMGEKVDIFVVKGVVDNLIKMFFKDSKLILNFSNTKSDVNDYLFRHVLNVSVVSINIAVSAGYSINQVSEVGLAALLSDVGMLLVPPSIRSKNEKLTDDELAEIRKHPITTSIILGKQDKIPASVKNCIIQVHERENGTGYPYGKMGKEIHNYAKIIQIADIYDAMTSPRIHKERKPPFKAMETLIHMAVHGLISKQFLNNLLEVASIFPIGTVVVLNNNSIAKVIETNSENYSRPIVVIIGDNQNGVFEDKSKYKEVNLLKEEKISIVSSIHTDTLESIGLLHGF